MRYRRMPIEEESPEQLGYDRIRFNLTESSVRDRSLADLGIEMGDMVLFYGDHAGDQALRELINKGIAAVQADGTYAKIQKKYFGDQDIYNE